MQDTSKVNDLQLSPPDRHFVKRNNSAASLSYQKENQTSLSPTHSPLFRPNDIEFNFSPTGSTQKSSLTGATLNFTNSIIGAGIISLPYAVSQAGIVLGFVLLVGIGVLVDWTVLLLVRTGKLCGQHSYQAIMGKTYGAWGRFSITCFQVMFAFGAMIAYVIIIGDTLPAVFQSIFGSNTWFFDRIVFILLSVVALLPLSLTNNLTSLSTTSAVSLASVVLIIFAVIITVGSVPEELLGNPNAKILWIGPAPFKAIGIIAFELPTLDRFSRVTHYATLISLVFSILLAYFGYFTFVEKTAGNVLNNFPATNAVMNVARFCFALNMLTTYPIECFVACHVLQDYFEFYHRRLWGAVLVFLSVAIACFVPDVSLILEITGNFSASALAFILPPLLWLKLAKTSRWLCYLCIVFGAVVLLSSLVF